MSDSPATPTGPTGAPHQALYRRFRAQTFGQIIGQKAVVQTLRNAVRLDRLGHGFLFVGPRGTGKTSMARILAKAVNCTDLVDGEPCDRCPSCVSIREGRAFDVIELDAASNNKVDDMRELVPRVYTAASDLRRKVFIIDEVQRIKEGWDVLLKTLEEPPDGVLFVFCTTDPSQIRPAVVSRLQRFTFRPLAASDIESKLRRILEEEGRRADDEALALIARLAAGGMRDAESMLDQVLGNVEDPISAGTIQDLLGLADSGAVDRFVDALVGADVLAGINVLDELEADGRDVVAFSEQVVARLRELLVETLSTRPGARDRARASALADAARRLTGLDASRAGLGGYRWQLELCLLRAAAAADAAPDGPLASVRQERPPETVRQERPSAQARPAAPAGAQAPDLSDPPAPTSPEAVDPPARTASNRAPAREPISAAAPRPAGEPMSAAAPRPAAEPISAAAPRPAAEPGAPAAPPASDDVLAMVVREWPAIVAHVGRNPANRPIVAACRPVEMRDGILVLGFPEDQSFLRDVAERKRAALEDGISAVVGRPVGVRCVVTNVELAPVDGIAADDLVSHARRIFDDDLVGVDEID